MVRVLILKKNQKMNYEQLEKAIELKKQIEEVENCIKNISAAADKATWIDFSHGNGSEKFTVSRNKETIKKALHLIQIENELELDRLKTEFKNL